MFASSRIKLPTATTPASLIVDRNSTSRYPHRLNFYEKPPLEDVTLEEFELFAIARLRVLSEIESCLIRNLPYDKIKKVINEQIDKNLPLNLTKTLSDTEEQRRKDHISHFVLRLAFCRSEELRRRFLKAESYLFRARYEMELQNDRTAFLDSLDFNWSPIDISDLKPHDSLRKELEVLNPSKRWFKVKWTQVPNLVEKRRVILKAGWAYVPEREQSSIVYQEFDRRLEKALEMTSKALPRLDEDTRVLPILDHLGQGFLSGMSAVSEYSAGEGSGEGVTADMIDEMAEKHWPMCMRNLHENLRRDRHLKHFARQQYGLFLKVVGLSVDEAVHFWRKAFSGRITEEKFNKEYKYNIRHSFGLEGKRVNYPAFSCQTIITQHQPGTQDCHGCPFRHFSHDRLQTALITTYGSQGLRTTDLPEIMTSVKENHFHVACTRVFEATHGLASGDGLDGESVTHPNQYVAKSRDMEKEKTGVKSEPKLEASDDAMDIS